MRRKVTIFVILTAVTLFLLSSCKSTSKCPAYSHLGAQETNQTV